MTTSSRFKHACAPEHDVTPEKAPQLPILTDAQLAATWRAVYEQEGLYLEPSAAAGFAGLPYFADTPHATHLVWVTGGGLQPQAAIQEYLAACHVE